MILLVMTDGRVDCLSRAIESARENLCGEVTHKVIHDDTGDESGAFRSPASTRGRGWPYRSRASLCAWIMRISKFSCHSARPPSFS